MLLLHAVDIAVTAHAQSAHEHLEAGVLRVIRNAVLVILLIAFLVGGFLGFLVGRAYGRREKS